MPMRAAFVSRNSLAAVLMPNLLLIAEWPVLASAEAERAAEQRSSPSPAAADRRTDAQAWFAKGQTALQAGDLEAAAAAFRGVLAADPGAGSADANLWVIARRPQDSAHAIEVVHRAQELETNIAGIRLDSG